MVAERLTYPVDVKGSCSLAKISMVAEHVVTGKAHCNCCSLAKISMVAERWHS